MDKQYSVQFFTKFVEAMQKFCRDYIEFEQAVELSGYLSLEIDNYKKERYVLSEMVHSTGDVISESYCVKAFKTMKRLPVRNSDSVLRDNTNTSSNHQVDSIDLRDSPPHYGDPYQLQSRHRSHSHQSSSHQHNMSNQQSYRHSMNRRHNPPSFASGTPDSVVFTSASLASHMEEPSTIQPRQSVQYLTNSSHSNPVTAVVPSFDDVEADQTGITSNMNPFTSASDSIHSEDSRGQKRSSVQEESVPSKKEKFDNELDSLLTAATSMVGAGESNTDPSTTVSDNVPQSQSANLDIQNTDQSSHSINENMRLPENIQIKEEVDPDIMFIDSPGDDKSVTESGGYPAEGQSYTSTEAATSDPKSSQRTSDETFKTSKISGQHLSDEDSKMWQREKGIHLPSTSVDEPKLQSHKSLHTKSSAQIKNETDSQEETILQEGCLVRQPLCVGVTDVQSTFRSGASPTDAGALSRDSSEEIRKFIYPFRKRLPPPKGGHRCELCGYRTDKLSNFKRHQRCHTGDFFQCYLCPRQFCEKLKLSYHLQGHRGELVCRYCNKVFASRQGYIRHEKACRLKKGNSCSCKQ